MLVAYLSSSSNCSLTTLCGNEDRLASFIQAWIHCQSAKHWRSFIKFSHISACNIKIDTLHWLSVEGRTKFKILLLAGFVDSLCSIMLTRAVFISVQPGRSLRSSACEDLRVPRCVYTSAAHVDTWMHTFRNLFPADSWVVPLDSAQVAFLGVLRPTS